MSCLERGEDCRPVTGPLVDVQRSSMGAEVADDGEAVVGAELEGTLVALVGHVSEDAHVVGMGPGQFGDLQIGGDTSPSHGRVHTDAFEPALIAAQEGHACERDRPIVVLAGGHQEHAVIGRDPVVPDLRDVVPAVPGPAGKAEHRLTVSGTRPPHGDRLVGRRGLPRRCRHGHDLTAPSLVTTVH